MIYWFTGQPGHGKTLHAIEKLLEYKDKGRIVYACNIRGFDYAKTGVIEMTPEQFRDWMNFLPDGAVALVDEAYEHHMLPKRPPGGKVPAHVEQLAKHRHRGLDFIFVSQSPDKQCDQFVQDLIERHVHVRRMFGTQYVQLREFDRFEARAEKATPIVNRRRKLPKRPMGTYQSTEMDTTERRVPWYWWAAGIGGPLGLLFVLWVFYGLGDRLGGGTDPANTPPAITQGAARDNGALATVAAQSASARMTTEQYAARFTPRIASQPWSAPAYDNLTVPAQPPRLFCMISGPGVDANFAPSDGGCSCITDQGTRYGLDRTSCEVVAIHGQYEPFRQNTIGDDYRMDGQQLQERHYEDARRINSARGVPGVSYGAIAAYGDYGIETGRYQVQSIR